MIAIGSRVRYLQDGCFYRVMKELRRDFFRCEGPPLPGRSQPSVIEARRLELREVSD